MLSREDIYAITSAPYSDEARLASAKAEILLLNQRIARLADQNETLKAQLRMAGRRPATDFLTSCSVRA